MTDSTTTRVRCLPRISGADRTQPRDRQRRSELV